MSSSFGYNEWGWVTNLTTPYGTTSFEHVDLNQASYTSRDRSITITQPNNGKQIYAFYMSAPFETGPIPGPVTPTNTPIGTLDDEYVTRDSYHWGPLQYAALSTANISNFTAGDYIKARLRHWLGATVEGSVWSMDTLSIQREPSQDGST